MRASLLLYITSSPDIKQILKSFVVDGSEKFTGCGRETCVNNPESSSRALCLEIQGKARYKSLHDCVECLENRL
jgi:hypothetical protein